MTGMQNWLRAVIQKLGGAARAGQSFPIPEVPVAQSTKVRDVERRQLTVMFCDLVNSTELSERLDPEELRELMVAYGKAGDEVVARYKGRVEQHLGDGLMAYFGWPRAHEDDAERSVRAALDIVHAVKAVPADPPLRVRVGVATGEVAIGGPDQELAHGRTPNLAARLQSLAGPDQVVIASGTRRLVGETFELAALGSCTLKGIAEPEQVWRVKRVGDAASRFEASRGARLTPLVGREAEIERLLERRRLAAGKSEGQVVLLSGGAGIGKSRVLGELRKRIEEEGVQALRFQCSPYHANSAFWPSIDGFERTLRFARDEKPESKLDKLERLVVDEYELPRSDVRFIASILSIPHEDRYGPLAMTPQRKKDETLRTLVDLTEAAVRKQPCVVLFEDVHWADETTLEVLDLLIDRAKGLPLLMVLTHRPEFRNRWEGHDHVTAIDLTRLTREQSREMVSRLSEGEALSDDLIEEIVVKADGVPLFIEELTKSVVDQVRDAGDRGDGIDPPHGIAVPATLKDSLMARLDRNELARDVAKIGAAIGRAFSYELVSAVAPWPEQELQRMLGSLTASGLAFQRGCPPEATYFFKHALVQDAAYDSLLKREKRKRHTDIARTIEERFPNIGDTEPEVLARHYTEAGMWEKGAVYWIKAGQKAHDRWALKEAIAHLEKGLRVIGSMPPHARDSLELECRVELSTAWEAYRGWASPELPKVLEDALPLARAAGQRKFLARTLWGLWVQLMSVGPVAKSLVWAEELLSAGEREGDEELLLVGHMSVMVGNFWLGNPVVVKEHAEAILELYERERHGHIVNSMNHDPKTLAGIYLSQVLWILGYPDQAAAIVEERDAHARRIGHPFDTGFALTLGAWVFHYRREPEKLLARDEEVRELARDAGLPFISEILAPYLSTGISLVQQGRLSEGIEHLERGIRSWEAAGAKTVTPYIRSRLGEALALDGNVDLGLSHVDAMLEQIRTPGWEERSHLAEILRLKGWMLSLKGDHAGAERSYNDSLDCARKQEARSWELRTATGLARLLQEQGRSKEAHDLLSPIYGWFGEGFDTKDLVEAGALLAELAE